jgi:hypothetical protein
MILLRVTLELRKSQEAGMYDADTISSFEVARVRGTTPKTERKRAWAGIYGPLASAKPLRLYRREVERAGVKLPPKLQPMMAADYHLALMLRFATSTAANIQAFLRYDPDQIRALADHLRPLWSDFGLVLIEHNGLLVDVRRGQLQPVPFEVVLTENGFQLAHPGQETEQETEQENAHENKDEAQP